MAGKFTRVMSLRQPAVKMSKSDQSPLSRIEITDSSDEIRNKIRKAVTDSESHIDYDASSRPGLANLVDLYSAFAGITREEVCLKYQNLEQCKSLFKADLAEILVSELEPIRSEISRLQRDPAYVDEVLRRGSDRARQIASKNLDEVKELAGLVWGFGCLAFMCRSCSGFSSQGHIVASTFCPIRLLPIRCEFLKVFRNLFFPIGMSSFFRGLSWDCCELLDPEENHETRKNNTKSICISVSINMTIQSVDWSILNETPQSKIHHLLVFFLCCCCFFEFFFGLQVRPFKGPLQSVRHKGKDAMFRFQGDTNMTSRRLW